MDEAPEIAENLPALHGLHPDSSETPVADEYLPSEQFRQVVMSFAPRALLHVPFSQSTHAVWPELAYKPLPQSIQFPPDALILPESHPRHSRLPSSPVISLPASQTPHTVLPFSRSVYVPGSQSSHDISPADDVNVSVRHARHVNALKYFPALHGTSAI